MKKLTVLLAAALFALVFCSALAEVVPVTLTGNGAQCADANVIIEGSKITFTAPGEYEIAGSLNNGQLVIDSEYDGKVILTLNQASIHNENGAAIHILQCSPRAVIVLKVGTQNALSGGSEYELDEKDEPNGVLFGKDDFTIEGEGALSVTANYMDGIVSKDDIRIKGGILSISAPRNGIRGKDSVEISGGKIDIAAGNDGIKSTNEKEATKGFVAITGGEIVIRCADDPISVVTRLTITGGSVDAIRIAEE